MSKPQKEIVYTQAIAPDGPAILKDGKPMTAEDIVKELNSYRLSISMFQWFLESEIVKREMKHNKA